MPNERVDNKPKAPTTRRVHLRAQVDLFYNTPVENPADTAKTQETLQGKIAQLASNVRGSLGEKLLKASLVTVIAGESGMTAQVASVRLLAKNDWAFWWSGKARAVLVRVASVSEIDGVTVATVQPWNVQLSPSVSPPTPTLTSGDYVTAPIRELFPLDTSELQP